MFSAASRYVRTLAHLKPWQIGGRVYAGLKRKLPLDRLPPVPEGLTGAFAPRVPPPHHDPWNTSEALLAGQFRFLNHARTIGWPPDWQSQDAPLLWRFNLHYFQYLHLLPPEAQVAVCRSWINCMRPGSVGWHAYPTSLRIVNWCRANLQEPDLQASLYQQAAHLVRNLETYVYGNHLLENARALVHAGTFFSGQGEASQWLAKGLQIYREQTPEQVLPDGGHFERSPMYHALMLEGYVDVLNLLPADHPDQPWLREAVHRMLGFLRATTHPDGELALFNDATQEIALKPETLEAYATAVAGRGAAPTHAYPDTGYYVYRNPDVYLMVDAGPAGADYLMAHAHADLFSFELSVGGQQIVTDSGVFEYPPGNMRDFVRSTRAHNTVTVDGVDQIECWGSFRVGQRSAPGDVSCDLSGQGMVIKGTFPGYARRIGDKIEHTRRMEVDAQERIIRVTDTVTGTGTHVVESRLHLHPEVSVSQNVLTREAISCRLETDDEVRLEEGWYCPRFGERLRRSVIVIGGACRLPAKLSYVIRY